MKVRMALMLLVGLMFVQWSTGLRTVPIGKRSLISRDACTEDELQRAAMGFPVECMQDQRWQFTGNNQHGHGHANPLHFGNNRRLKTLPDACTEADLARADMGMPVACLGGYGSTGTFHPGATFPHSGHGHASGVDTDTVADPLSSGFNTHTDRKLLEDDHHDGQHARRLLRPFDNVCSEVDLARYQMGFHVSCMDSVLDTNAQPTFQGSYDENREWGTRHDTWGDRMAFGRGLRHILGVFTRAKSANLAAIRNAPTRNLLDTNACSEAELVRASMGFDMECMHPDNWEDRSWRRRWWNNNFIRPRGNIRN